MSNLIFDAKLCFALFVCFARPFFSEFQVTNYLLTFPTRAKVLPLRSPNPTIDEHAFSQMQLEASPSPEIAPFEEQTIRDVSPQLSVKDFMSDNSEIHEEEASHQPQPEEVPIPDRVDDTPVRRPASVQAAPKK